MPRCLVAAVPGALFEAGPPRLAAGGAAPAPRPCSQTGRAVGAAPGCWDASGALHPAAAHGTGGEKSGGGAGLERGRPVSREADRCLKPGPVPNDLPLPPLSPTAALLPAEASHSSRRPFSPLHHPALHRGSVYSQAQPHFVWKRQKADPGWTA